MIDRFDGTAYKFLSNFYEADVTYDGLTFANSEAAFQAAKVLDEEKRKEFCNLNPKSAKAKGKKVPLRGDWEEVKDQVMYEVVTAKFEQHPDLMEKLLATGEEELIEGNTWRDRYWGVYNGKGKNMLGKTLMRVRDEHKNKGEEKTMDEKKNKIVEFNPKGDDIPNFDTYDDPVEEKEFFMLLCLLQYGMPAEMLKEAFIIDVDPNEDPEIEEENNEFLEKLERAVAIVRDLQEKQMARGFLINKFVTFIEEKCELPDGACDALLEL